MEVFHKGFHKRFIVGKTDKHYIVKIDKKYVENKVNNYIEKFLSHHLQQEWKKKQGVIDNIISSVCDNLAIKYNPILEVVIDAVKTKQKK